MAGASAAVGHNGRRAFHHGFPIRVGHVGNQHVAGLHDIHLRSVFHQAHAALADFLADGAAFAQYGFVAGNGVAAQAASLLFFLRFHGFRACLQNVQFAVQAVATPFDVHRAAVVFFDNQRVFRQFGNFFIGNGELLAFLFGNIHHLHRFAGLRAVGKRHFDEFGTHGFAQNGGFAGTKGRFVYIKFVRIDRALYNGFAQAVGSSNEYNVFKAAFGVDGEHHAGRAAVGTHHALNACRQRNNIVRKAFMHTIGNGAVVV